MFCFFFSSRRRHTSSDRDWSSDVCSSDLGPGDRLRALLGPQEGPTAFTTARIPATEDYQIVRELEAAKVEFSGRIESTFWRDLFSWVVPLIIMAALWL